MKKIFTLIVACAATVTAFAQVHTSMNFIGNSNFSATVFGQTISGAGVKDTVTVGDGNTSITFPSMAVNYGGTTMTVPSMNIANLTYTMTGNPMQGNAVFTWDKAAGDTTINFPGIGNKKVQITSLHAVYTHATGQLETTYVFKYGDMPGVVTFTSTGYYTVDNAWKLVGRGTAKNPYKVYDAADFAAMAANISETNTGSGEYFQMMNDVDFAGTEASPAILPCIGVAGLCGTNEKTGAALGRLPNAFVWGFQGNFDGNGKAIKGIWQNTSTGCDALFSTLGEGGVVKNLTFAAENSITTTGSYCAPFVAVNYAGTVDGCVNNAAVTGKIYTSGICNFLVKCKGTVQNCTNNGAITSTLSYAAGIVAGAQSGPTVASTDAGYAGNVIDNCINNGVCTSKGVGAGGIAGSFSGKITNCTNNAEVTGTGLYAGGIVACQTYLSDVSGNTNKGTITGKNNVAGIMGYIMKAGNEAFDISNNTNEGTYTATATTGTISTGPILGGSARDQKDVKPTSTGVSNVNAGVNANANGKFILNGKFVIVKDGKQYNAAGMQIK